MIINNANLLTENKMNDASDSNSESSKLDNILVSNVTFEDEKQEFKNLEQKLKNLEQSLENFKNSEFLTQHLQNIFDIEKENLIDWDLYEQQLKALNIKIELNNSNFSEKNQDINKKFELILTIIKNLKSMLKTELNKNILEDIEVLEKEIYKLKGDIENNIKSKSNGIENLIDLGAVKIAKITTVEDFLDTEFTNKVLTVVKKMMPQQ